MFGVCLPCRGQGKLSPGYVCVQMCDDMDDLVAHPLAASSDPINLKLLL